MAATTHPVRVEAALDARLSRWRWLIKWFLAMVSSAGPRRGVPALCDHGPAMRGADRQRSEVEAGGVRGPHAYIVRSGSAWALIDAVSAMRMRCPEVACG
jgi:hypothetical protein